MFCYMFYTSIVLYNCTVLCIKFYLKPGMSSLHSSYCIFKIISVLYIIIGITSNNHRDHFHNQRDHFLSHVQVGNTLFIISL